MKENQDVMFCLIEEENFKSYFGLQTCDFLF